MGWHYPPRAHRLLLNYSGRAGRSRAAAARPGWAGPAARHTRRPLEQNPSCSVLTRWQRFVTASQRLLNALPTAEPLLLLGLFGYCAPQGEKRQRRAFDSFCRNCISTFYFSVPKSGFFHARDTLKTPNDLTAKAKVVFTSHLFYLERTGAVWRF